jgi:hypothetical protein
MRRPAIILLLLLPVIACEDEYGSNKHLVTFGGFEVDLNGRPWKYPIWEQFGTINGFTYKQSCESTELAMSWMRFDGKFSFDNSDEAELRFNKVPLLPGKYALEQIRFGECDSDNVVETIFWLRFGDTLGDRFQLIETVDNFFAIDSYDSISKVITGSFQGTYVNDRIPSNSNWYPDTLKFTNGKFRTKIFD